MKLRAAVHQATPAERVHERAAEEARARLSRIEYRRALGISPQRPTMHLQPLYQNVLYVCALGHLRSLPGPVHRLGAVIPGSVIP